MVGLGKPAAALEDRLVVLTSFPPEVITRYEEAFNKAHPGMRLEILWRMPDDALPYLLDPQNRSADVYWSASPRVFATLREKGVFVPFSGDRSGLPATIGKQFISDPDGYYLAPETAGLGFSINPAYLAARGLATPRDWEDLAAPAYAGHISLPAPSKFPFAHYIVEIITQSRGWASGWALFSQIAGNSEIADSASFQSDAIPRGKFGVGITMDFFAASAAANGAAVDFIRPPGICYSPAAVAVLTTAPHPAAAQEFVAFLLSETGQKILLRPEVRKLPVRPSVYADAPDGYFNPFVHAEHQTFSCNQDLVRHRRALDEALFDQMVMQRQPAFQAMWDAIRKAEAAVGKNATGRLADTLKQAKLLASKLPVSSRQAADEAYLRMFDSRHANPAAESAAHAEEARWGAFFDGNYRRATDAARRVLAATRQG